MTTDEYYKRIIETCLSGEKIQTRNSTCYRAIAQQVWFTSTPLVCLRKTAWKNCLREWEWFMSGSDNISDLHPSVKSWWEPWVTTFGKIWFNYSKQFRSFGTNFNAGFDQIKHLIDGVKDHPFSRRNVISTWHTEQMASHLCAITNCHGTVIQAFVDNANMLHIVTYQRSVDVICGLPHNWLQYWAFTQWLAYRSGRKVGSLTWIGGDVHVYEAHLPLAKKILAAKGQCPPQLTYKPTADGFLADDFSLDGEYMPVIADRAEMIV